MIPDTMSTNPASPLLSAPFAPPGGSARQRILAAAYDLFSRQGIRAVGIDAIIAHSGVARMTLYRHFTSKEQLVIEYLEMRAALWTTSWLRAEVERRATPGPGRLLAIFDVFDEWFRREEFEGCAFINVMLESEPGSAVREASIAHLERIRDFIAELAAECGIEGAPQLARKWHILMKGCIVAAAEGDRDAARCAREIAELLLEQSAG